MSNEAERLLQQRKKSVAKAKAKAERLKNLPPDERWKEKTEEKAHGIISGIIQITKYAKSDDYEWTDAEIKKVARAIRVQVNTMVDAYEEALKPKAPAPEKAPKKHFSF